MGLRGTWCWGKGGLCVAPWTPTHGAARTAFYRTLMTPSHGTFWVMWALEGGPWDLTRHLEQPAEHTVLGVTLASGNALCIETARSRGDHRNWCMYKRKAPWYKAHQNWTSVALTVRSLPWLPPPLSPCVTWAGEHTPSLRQHRGARALGRQPWSRPHTQEGRRHCAGPGDASLRQGGI